MPELSGELRTAAAAALLFLLKEGGARLFGWLARRDTSRRADGRERREAGDYFEERLQTVEGLLRERDAEVATLRGEVAEMKRTHALVVAELTMKPLVDILLENAQLRVRIAAAEIEIEQLKRRT